MSLVHPENPTICDGCKRQKPEAWPAYNGWASVSISRAVGGPRVACDDFCPACIAKMAASVGIALPHPKTSDDVQIVPLGTTKQPWKPHHG